jgi:Tfp pilus assembly protein PilF
MNRFIKLLVLPAAFGAAYFLPNLGFAQAPAAVTPPSASYGPSGAELSSRYAGYVPQIVSASNSNDKATLIGIADELMLIEDSNTRGDEDEKYFLIGYAKRNAGDLSGAIQAFKQSLEFRDNSPNTRYLLALTHKESGNCEDALKDLDQLRFLMGSETASSFLMRADCLARLNRQPEADLVIAAGRKAFAGDLPIKKLSLSFKAKAMALGAVLDELQTNELESDLPDLAAANPDDSNIQIMYGKTLLKKGDVLTKNAELDTALAIATKEVEKSAYKNEKAVKLLFDVLLKQRKNAEVVQLLKTLEANQPKNSELLASAKKQFEIETQGLRILKYDRR